MFAVKMTEWLFSLKSLGLWTPTYPYFGTKSKKKRFFTPSLIAMLCLQNPLRELHIATVAIHDDFDYTGLVNDIAILKTGIKDFYFLQT